MTTDESMQEFSAMLHEAQRGVNFGPLDGFGGHGSGKVWQRLPEVFRAYYDGLGFSRALLVGSPKSIVDFAKACGIDFLGGFAAIAAERIGTK